MIQPFLMLLWEMRVSSQIPAEIAYLLDPSPRL